MHKVSTCGCSGMLNACLLMLENPTLSYFCLLLAAGSNGCFLVFSLLSALVLFAFSVPPPFLQHWHRKGRAESQNNPASSSVLQTEFMSCTGLLPQGKKKKTLTRSKATFQSKVNMRPMIGCIWHKKKYVLPVDQVRRLRYQLHFLLKATRLSWG